jgi:hypothetical protein
VLADVRCLCQIDARGLGSKHNSGKSVMALLVKEAEHMSRWSEARYGRGYIRYLLGGSC